MSATAADAGTPTRSTIPARLDRMSRSPFHTRMVAGLGAAWILDGLQVTISSSVTGVGGRQAEGQSLETITKPLTATSDTSSAAPVHASPA
jgi:hypothetical protein